MVSRGDAWRRRVERRLANVPVGSSDPVGAMLARVIGEPAPELIEKLEGPSTQAAVLVGLIERAQGPTVLLTRRARGLQHHPGQISFPGGRIEAGEAPRLAALREAHEEVGLSPSKVDLLGSLPLQLTGTGFLVTPVVGWLAADFEPEPSPAEVELAFEVRLDDLVHDSNRRRSSSRRWGTWFETEEFHLNEQRIWGATANILSNFLEIIDAKTI